MRIIDSNLIIYFANPGFEWLGDYIQTVDSFYSDITKIEVLGYHKITSSTIRFFNIYFDSITALPLTQEILDKTISLKQSKKMTLGDSIIAATALIYNLDLYTHNVSDFESIQDLRIIDPIR
jgi:predicted nucleic acid-binding protein